MGTGKQARSQASVAMPAPVDATRGSAASLVFPSVGANSDPFMLASTYQAIAVKKLTNAESQKAKL